VDFPIAFKLSVCYDKFMLERIKNRIETELHHYSYQIDKLYSLKALSPLLLKNIRKFIAGAGKRTRPILFIIAYLGFSKKTAPRLYRSALALELLHDFMLIHDDIIDKSPTRRGKPSLHTSFNQYLQKYQGLKFNGQDLGIIVGDIIFAMALEAFLSVEEDHARKELALRQFIRAALYTGSGEFMELLAGIKDIEEITKQEIYKIYDTKTANYTFATPLAMGAILAGAKKRQRELIYRLGIYLGRAFQIKDDIIGIFAQEAVMGKPNLTDLQEARKTILVWSAYHHSPKGDQAAIKRILSKVKVARSDLFQMRRIILESGALEYATKEIAGLIQQAQRLLASCGMQPRYRQLLSAYAKQLLKLC
jgi:geranylgeranyl diphosphate synthase type I